jgi:mRNA-degrading endonuclease RelE of RelBE toxin-antitoxin system
MKFAVEFTKRAAKEVALLDAGVRNKVRTELERLVQDPFCGSHKVGNLEGVRGHGFYFGGTAYRIAYLIDGGKLVILVIMVGTREGFWEKLSRTWK